ncbi:MAG TPA: adenylate/guanylate cyclase domain-containing protein [Flexivirga sp.]|uniref:adenylate/guanylate cyclase domain-containing protein n=1 Tax=Flexivirga sp. TaxID=1962927 RepID=UPI002BC0332C|nr:adenylate/guanylate cyclase domain-containing protein [Flexivirga sp.]HWC23453.1 adenylate/guanylate cyclase domain-containing protein [Flexivirga sp.]
MTTCARCGAELPGEARFCLSCGAAVAQGGLQAPVRKHVVILFCDIVGSTTLGEAADPESLRERLARYFDVVSKAIWEQGGTVEKFIGDAVMAVFGVPSTLEDDAARAVRAASGIHEAVAGLSAQFEQEIGVGLHVRIGVNSGEVFVTHQPDGQFSVTGDAVNAAQRLEAAAGTDETYVGDTVAELVSGDIVLDDVGEILHKGKTVPQQVFRVAADQGRELAVREPEFVGRAGELADLTALADRSDARKEGWLLTYVGDAGIGKSRLIRHFAAGRGDRLRVVAGGCDAMNTGAFAPLSSWLGSLEGDWEAYVGQLLGDESAAVLQRLRSAVGRSDAQTSVEDVVWAVQEVLAALCETAPVLSVWDDLHWATPAQLDFIGRTAEASRGLPVLTTCLGRPELFDVDARWGGGRKSRVEDVVPLDDEDLLAIAVEAISLQAKEIEVSADDLVTRADGNPQVVQLLAQSAAAGEGLPASVTQLYEAALDRLTADERSLVEVAAVYGRRFPIAPVAETAELSDPAPVVARLRARNVLEVAGDGDYRFAQAVFLQTTYRTMPKRTRITRHSALADWIGAHRDDISTDPVALVASHRRRAYELLQEIDGAVAERQALQERAAQSALEMLRAQELRGDPAMPASIDVVLSLLALGDVRHFEVTYAVALARNAGTAEQQWEAWLDLLDTAMAQDPTWQVVRLAPRHLVEIRRGGLTLAAARDEAVEMVRRLRDIDGVDAYAADLAAIYLAQVEADLGNLGACHELCVVQAGIAGDGARSIVERVWLNFDLQISYGGNTPLPEVIATAQRLQASVAGHRGLWGTTTAVLAAALASSGRFEEARRQWEQHSRALDGVDRRETLYDLQHYQRTLAAEGKLAAAAEFAVQLSRRADDAMFVSFATSLLGAAARWALFDGDAQAARAHVDDALAVDLPKTLDWHRADVQAFTVAIEHAHAGNRAAAFEQIEIGSRVDRPEESLDTAGIVHTVTAIVEHLLGDETASRAAAVAAKDAFDRKGAVALRDQVDTWVGNADKLRC